MSPRIEIQQVKRSKLPEMFIAEHEIDLLIRIRDNLGVVDAVRTLRLAFPRLSMKDEVSFIKEL